MVVYITLTPPTNAGYLDLTAHALRANRELENGEALDFA